MRVVLVVYGMELEATVSEDELLAMLAERDWRRTCDPDLAAVAEIKQLPMPERQAA